MNPDLVPDGWQWRPPSTRTPRSPKAQRKRAERIRSIAERDGWRCRFCLRPLAADGGVEIKATIDHWTSRARRGTDRIANLVLADQPCNQIKGSLTGEEFLAIPREERENRRAAWLEGLRRSLQ